MASHLDTAAVRRSLMVYLVGRAAALPLFLFFGYHAIDLQQTPWPGALAMANGVVGLALVLWAYRSVGGDGTARPEVALWTLAGFDAVTLVLLWVFPAVLLGVLMGLLVFFLVIDLFSAWTVRSARAIRTAGQ